MEHELIQAQMESDTVSDSLMDELAGACDRSREEAQTVSGASPMPIEWGHGHIELVDANSSLREVLDVAYNL